VLTRILLQAFPLVYYERYHFSLGAIGLIFLTVIVGSLSCAIIYAIYLQYRFIPYARAEVDKFAAANASSNAVNDSITRANSQSDPEAQLKLQLSRVSTATGTRPHINQAVPQESWLLPSIPFSFLCPAGLFLFAWTSVATNASGEPRFSWIVPTIGIGLFSGGSYVVFQCTIIYISLSYRRYFASLSAAYDMSRGSLAAGVVMGSRAVFVSWGVDNGVSLLAGISAAGVFGMWFLWWYGGVLRSKSRFAEKQ
jgi:hypothetical protein